MGEFKRVVCRIFTGSAGYSKYKEYVLDCLDELEATLKKELLEALESSPPYRLARVEQVVERWFGDE